MGKLLFSTTAVFLAALLHQINNYSSPVSAVSTTPSKQPKRLLMPAAALQTKGGAAGAAAARNVKLAASASSAAATYDGHRDDTTATTASEAALHSIRTCYRTCFFAIAVDVLTTLIDEKMWSKLLSGRISLRYTDYVDIFDSMSNFIFALGLHRLSKFYEQMQMIRDDEKTTATRSVSDENLSSFFSLMYWIWRVVAVNLALGSLSLASALPQISFTWLGLRHVSSSSIVMVVATTIALGYSIVNSFCERIATVEDERDNNRISSNQRESKTQPHYKSIRILGYRAFCGQALCAASFGIYSCMEFSKWLVAADTGIVGRASSFGQWAEPFAMTALLIGLNKAFLRAAIVRSRDESRETAAAEMDEEIYNDLFTAQIKFYTKVAEVVKGM